MSAIFKTTRQHLRSMFANGVSAQLVPLEIVGKRAQARVECTPSSSSLKLKESHTRLAAMV